MRRFPDGFRQGRPKGAGTGGQACLPAADYTEGWRVGNLKRAEQIEQQQQIEQASREAAYPMRSTKL
jgi:hypothetical protein